MHYTDNELINSYVPFTNRNVGYSNSIAHVNYNPGMPVFDIIECYLRLKGLGSSMVDWNNILNKPTFATIATTGNYSDLVTKPNISNLNDVTLTSLVDNQILMYSQSLQKWVNVFANNLGSNLATTNLTQTDTYRSYTIPNGKELNFKVNDQSNFEVVTEPRFQGNIDVSAGFKINKSDGILFWNRASNTSVDIAIYEDAMETSITGDYAVNVSKTGSGTTLFNTNNFKIEIAASTNSGGGFKYKDFRSGAVNPVANKHILGFITNEIIGPVNLDTLRPQVDWNETNPNSYAFIKNKPTGSSTDSNFANTNLTLTADRIHDGNNKNLYIGNVNQLALGANGGLTLSSADPLGSNTGEMGINSSGTYIYNTGSDINLNSDNNGNNTTELNISGSTGLTLKIKNNIGKVPTQVLTLKPGNKADWESIDYNNLINKPVIANSVNYSTTEQLSGRKWIDNKDIYQKTFHSPVFTITSNTINNVDALVNIEGYIHNGTNKYNWGSAVGNSAANLVSNTLTVSANTGYTVTVYYTKI